MSETAAGATRVSVCLLRRSGRCCRLLIDLHLWRLGPGHLGAVVSVMTNAARDCAFYRSRLSQFDSLSHVTVEVVSVGH